MRPCTDPISGADTPALRVQGEFVIASKVWV